MEKTIEIAKLTLAEFFNIKKEEFDLKTRKRQVIEARRFLIYFMVSELGIKFNEVKNYLKSLKSHASAMHHYYKMMDLLSMKHERTLQQNYLNFKKSIKENGLGELEQELQKQMMAKREITLNIKQLKKLIDEG